MNRIEHQTDCGCGGCVPVQHIGVWKRFQMTPQEIRKAEFDRIVLWLKKQESGSDLSYWFNLAATWLEEHDSV